MAPGIFFRNSQKDETNHEQNVGAYPLEHQAFAGENPIIYRTLSAIFPARSLHF